MAIKVANKEKMLKLGMIERVYNEIKLLSSINHANIVKINCNFEDETNIYFAMELCRHGNLFKYLKCSGPLQEYEVRKSIHTIILL